MNKNLNSSWGIATIADTATRRRSAAAQKVQKQHKIASSASSPPQGSHYGVYIPQRSEALSSSRQSDRSCQ